jgi:kumamolisin
MYEKKVQLPGSERRLAPGARDIGDVDAGKEILVSVYVRPNPNGPRLGSAEELALVPPAQRHSPSAAELAAARNASDEDLRKVADYAASAGLQVIETSPSKRRVQLKGTIGAFARAFDVTLRRYEHVTGAYRGRTGPVHIPSELSGIVRAVFGLDNRRIGRSLRRSAAHTSLALSSSTRPFLPTELADIYNFPSSADGSGQCVAILAFNGQLADTGQSVNGGYSREGLQNYFTNQTRTRMPDIRDVLVHGPGNQPGDGSDPNDSTGEILLDLEMVGSLVPGARVVVYFTEFTEQGWVDAVHDVVHDAANNPSVLSISYGNSETGSDATNINTRGSLWTLGAIMQVNEAFNDAALKNITICAASGDDGSSDGSSDGLAHVDFPASSPFVLGCGGTRLRASQSGATETVWNSGRSGGATGGGISDLFELPSWQQNADVPASVNPGGRIGRGVPDVASVADPATGVLVSDLNGNVDPSRPTGGTSAAAPLWAALTARLNQVLGAPVGYLNPLLYTRCAHGVLRDVVRGNNGSYRARSGWDACTGIGSPDGVSLATSLGAPANIMVAAARSPERLAQLERRVIALESGSQPHLRPHNGEAQLSGHN